MDSYVPMYYLIVWIPTDYEKEVVDNYNNYQVSVYGIPCTKDTGVTKIAPRNCPEGNFG